MAHEDAKRLDALIDEIAAPSESQCELLREHLESARTYLLGSLQAEYVLSLRLAQQSVDCISDRERQKRLKSGLEKLLAEQEASVRGTRS